MPDPSRRGWACALLLLFAPILCLAQNDIAIVRGTSSLPNDAERRYGDKICKRISDWLTELNIPHDTLTDDEVAAGKLGRRRIAILAYNTAPGDRQLRALRRFCNNDGRLMVFYSSSKKLADIMGLNLAPYKASTIPGQWSAFRFSGGPRHAPPVVHQASRNVLSPWPRDRHSRVIAWWQNAAGTRQKDPAWCQSAYGYWMGHVLLADDHENKKHMLLSMIATVLHETWERGARYYAGPYLHAGDFADFEQTVTGIRNRAKGSTRTSEVDSLLRIAVNQRTDMRRKLAQHDFAQAIEQARHIRFLLEKAYGRSAEPKAGEFRGVWDHAGTGLYPGSWRYTCETLQQAGITAVFPNVMWPHKAHFRSQTIPISDIAKNHGDQLTQCIAAARDTGLEVHAWKVCWKLDNAPEAVLAPYRRAGRLQMHRDGQTLPWLCPSNPDNRRQELAGIIDLLKRYPVDGIHLDYIRYPHSRSCYCKGCRVRFTESTGVVIRKWPDEILGGEGAQAYNKWRVRNITRFVEEVRDVVRSTRPDARLSVAVYGSYPLCIASIAQDWGDWLERGVIDFACPMNYSNEIANFDKWTRAQVALPGSTGRLYPGIGVRASESRLDATDTIAQIERARELGTAGFMLFELNADLTREILPVLSEGITAPTSR